VLDNQVARLSVTRLVSYEGQIVGFFTLTNDCIIRKGISDDDGREIRFTFQKADDGAR
jgi:hypothetical protein